MPIGEKTLHLIVSSFPRFDQFEMTSLSLALDTQEPALASIVRVGTNGGPSLNCLLHTELHLEWFVIHNQNDVHFVRIV